MAPARHKLAHKLSVRRRLSVPRRALQIGLPVAGAVVIASSAMAMTLPTPAPMQSISSAAEAADTRRVIPREISVREAPISRSEDRVRLEAVPVAVDHRFVTAKLNVWSQPSEDSKLVNVLDWSSKVFVTGERTGSGEDLWSEIVVDERPFWVHGIYLAEEKPEPEPEPEPTSTSSSSEESTTSGIASAACATGSDVESGLVPNAIAVHRAVCAAFPEVTSYGGLRVGDDGEHGTGQALDIMITGSTGDAIAEYVRTNASALGVSEVLWSQQIWTVERSSEGWRYMEDMGSDTANHYDHVHVTVY